MRSNRNAMLYAPPGRAIWLYLVKLKIPRNPGCMPRKAPACVCTGDRCKNIDGAAL